MTESQWLRATDPEAMLALIARKATDRKARLLRCGTCRAFGDDLTEARGRGCVELAERYADGLAEYADMATPGSELLRSWVSAMRKALSERPADALEEAGCDNAEVLSHCRGDGPHVRGCWVVDMLLGKS